MIDCLTPPQMNDFCDLLGTPYAPVSKIAPVKRSNDVLTVSKRFENVPPMGWDRGDSCIHILKWMFGLDWEDRIKVFKDKF